MRLFGIILGLALLAAASARADLKQKFEEELAHPSSDAAIREAVEGRHVVLVGGFMTEFYRSLYFSDAQAYLDRVLPPGTADLVFPDWRQDAEANAPGLRAQLEQLYAAGGNRPLWVIGHSKGGQEVAQLALQTAVEKPELLRNQVFDRLVSVQGSIGGSPLAVMGELGCAVIAGQLGSLTPESEEQAKAFCAAMPTLDAVAAQQANQRWIAKLAGPAQAASRELVQRSLRFVRAVHWEKPQEKLGNQEIENFYSNVLARDVVSPFLLKGHALLRMGCAGLLGLGVNDGLVCLQDQILPGWGQDLTAGAPLDNDHADLAVASPVGNAGAELQPALSAADAGRLYREAFIRALLRSLR